MPRNSSGIYTLPSGNPVLADTVIETTWANPTLADVAQALTDSLDRNGRGNMLGPMKFADGSEGAPSIAFSTEPSTGFYRAGTRTLGVSVNGIERARFTDTELSTTMLLRVNDGAPADTAPGGIVFGPGVSATLYSDQPHRLIVRTLDEDRVLFEDQFTRFNQRLMAPRGDKTQPAYSFWNGGSTGLYLSTIGELVVSHGDTDRALFHATGVSIQGTLSTTGPISAPALAIAGTFTAASLTTTGAISAGTSLSCVGPFNVTGGASKMVGTLEVTGSILGTGGSAANPSYSFSGDQNTGMLNWGADGLGFACAGAYQGHFYAGGFSVNGQMGVGASVSANGNVIAGATVQGATVVANTNFFCRGISYFALGSQPGPSICWEGDSGTGLYRTPGQNGVNVAVAGNARMQIDAGQVFVWGSLVAEKHLYSGDGTFGFWFDGGAGRYFGYLSGYHWLFNTSNGNLIWNGGGIASMTIYQSWSGGPALIWANNNTLKPGGGVWESTSDVTIKQNVRDYTRGLDAIQRIQPRTYNYTDASGFDTAREHIGLVAQEVQETMPEMIGHAPKDSKGKALLTVNATPIIYALVNSVKELATRLAALEGKA